ncbi:unnamed protein product [Bursaphelenchus okinawaensis]|uniref:Uncharacterized protein n=1 Tax=Bursaphelenchus okinawaensis TaxID=465554 RepID=A0A811L778_9BILA|nr:unnamed protein product [Bursaphelenchus okinawaensis]CAG9119246.1 unnamed protein product [Bursaphelenchus okinawaensis]
MTKTHMETVTQTLVNFENDKMRKARPSRQALQRHISLIQTKRQIQSRLSLLKQVLIQEEFEDKVFRLNNTPDDTSDDEQTSSSSSSDSGSDSSSDSDDDDFGPRYSLVKRPRLSIMSSRKKSKK